MKSIGIVRKVDELGRIVIPREVCKTHGIILGETSMEIFVGDNGEIIIKKYEPACTMCGSSEMNELLLKYGIKLCKKCVKEAGGM